MLTSANFAGGCDCLGFLTKSWLIGRPFISCFEKKASFFKKSFRKSLITQLICTTIVKYLFERVCRLVCHQTNISSFDVKGCDTPGCFATGAAVIFMELVLFLKWTKEGTKWQNKKFVFALKHTNTVF